MSNQSIPVAILGATGYAGEGCVRILLGHPGFHIVHAGSDRLAGSPLIEAVPALRGECDDLMLTADTPEAIIASGAKAVLLAKKSPDVTKVVPQLVAAGIKIVDIGPEFRLRSIDDYNKWYHGPHDCPETLADAVYGLSELNTEKIAQASIVGNPGCYPTSILMPLIPLLRKGLINLSASICSVSYSGLSGAGKRFLESNNNLFYAMNENLHSYNALAHKHIAEIDQELSAAAGSAVHLQFIPHLAPITRGIHSTITCTLAADVSADDINAVWQESFADRNFVRICDNTNNVQISNVACSNYIDFAVQCDGPQAVICSVEDNLVKGASGQAVQNLNIMFGYDETSGLKARTL
ncbi:MAG: N-acetyl-gamma-glutamyl-phosphate reductase [Planctomycetes bacterium]|nr:N-acetyl-gamma-glutamyl-phosphate reductase [Planctomycetota bacterium]